MSYIYCVYEENKDHTSISTLVPQCHVRIYDTFEGAYNFVLSQAKNGVITEYVDPLFPHYIHYNIMIRDKRSLYGKLYRSRNYGITRDYIFKTDLDKKDPTFLFEEYKDKTVSNT